jgi:hypothetical protein
MRGSTVKRGRTWIYVLYLGRDSTGRKRQKWVGGFDTRRAARSRTAYPPLGGGCTQSRTPLVWMGDLR